MCVNANAGIVKEKAQPLENVHLVTEMKHEEVLLQAGHKKYGVYHNTSPG
jgi:hypothetical protein